MWKQLNGEDQTAVKQMTELFKVKYNKELTEPQVTAILKDGEKTFRAMYNPTEIDAMFKKPGELYQFIKTNIAGMDANGIDEVLTSVGLGIRRNALFGMNKADFSDISKLVEIKNTEVDPNKQAIAMKELRIRLDQIQSFAE